MITFNDWLIIKDSSLDEGWAQNLALAGAMGLSMLPSFSSGADNAPSKATVAAVKEEPGVQQARPPKVYSNGVQVQHVMKPDGQYIIVALPQGLAARLSSIRLAPRLSEKYAWNYWIGTKDFKGMKPFGDARDLGEKSGFKLYAFSIRSEQDIKAAQDAALDMRNSSPLQPIQQSYSPSRTAW